MLVIDPNEQIARHVNMPAWMLTSGSSGLNTGAKKVPAMLTWQLVRRSEKGECGARVTKQDRRQGST